MHMRAAFLFILVAIVIVSSEIAAHSQGQDKENQPSTLPKIWNFKSPAAVKAKRSYDEAVRLAHSEYSKKLHQHREALLKDMKAAMKDATMQGNLADANQIKAAIDEVTSVEFAESYGNVLYLTVLNERPIKLSEQGFGRGGSLTKPAYEIVVNGRRSLRGIGMHAAANGSVAVEYHLGGRYKVFQGSVGINDAALADGGSQTPVIFKIIGDGKVLWQSKPLRVPSQVTDFKVNVTGVNVLRLVVECPGGNRAAQAVWVEPRLEW